MKRLVALLLTASLSPAPTLAAELGEETPLSVQPVESAPIPVLAAAQLPEEALQIRSVDLSAAKSAQAQTEVAPSARAQQTLTATAARLNGKQDAQALASSFDGTAKFGAGLAAGALALAASPAQPVLALTPALPAVYEAWRVARAPRDLRWRSPDAAKGVADQLGEAAQVVPALVVAGFLLLLAHGLLGTGPAFGAAAGLAALLAGLGSSEALARSRGRVIQRWQASHDQKYRTDYATGALRDIRGRRYGQGSDRYDEDIPGRLSALESSALRLLGIGAVLALGHVLGAASVALLVANVVAAGGFALYDRFHKPPIADSQTEPSR